MRDGIYQLQYAGVSYSALGVFVFRNGQFTGIGPTGAKYDGTCTFEPQRNLYLMQGQAVFKPNTPTVTGFVTSDSEAVFPISGELSSPDPATRFSIVFGGRPVDVAVSYVCPLPG